MRTFTLIDDPPRPATGTGEVVVKVGKEDVTLKWEDGNITEVKPSASSDESFKNAFSDITMTEGGELGITTCFKCAFDTETQHRVCWPVPC